MSKPTQEELNQWSGAENFKQTQFVDAPVIQMDKLGTKFFIRNRKGEEGEEKEFGTEINGVVIRVRVEYQYFPYPYDGQHWSTSEENGQGSTFHLYHNVKGEKQNKIATGGIAYLQGRVAGKLSMGQVLYILIENELYRIRVRGSSFGNILDYYKKLDKESEGKEEKVHIYNGITKLGIVSKTHEESQKEYFTISFEKTKTLEEEQQNFVYEEMKKLGQHFNQIEALRIKQNEPAGVVKPVNVNLKDSEIPIVQEDEPTPTEKPEDDTIDVKNIPFG